MNSEIIKEYREARADGTAARSALNIARRNVEANNGAFPRWPGDDVTLDLPRGESVVMRLEHDDFYRDIEEEFQVTIDHSPGRWPRDYGAPDWWQDRDGIVYAMGDNWRDRMAFDFDAARALADSRAYFSRQGMARHDAWLAARQQRDKLADALRNYGNAGFVGYVVELRDADNRTISEESCWGFPGDTDDAGMEARNIALTIARQRAEYWERGTETARNIMRKARQAFADLAREYRQARAIGPAVCDAIRARMDSLRADFRAALQIVAAAHD